MEFSGNPLSFLKEVKSIVVFDVEHGVALKPMKENRVLSRVDLGYTEPSNSYSDICVLLD